MHILFKYLLLCFYSKTNALITCRIEYFFKHIIRRSQTKIFQFNTIRQFIQIHIRIAVILNKLKSYFVDIFWIVNIYKRINILQQKKVNDDLLNKNNIKINTGTWAHYLQYYLKNIVLYIDYQKYILRYSKPENEYLKIYILISHRTSPRIYFSFHKY